MHALEWRCDRSDVADYLRAGSVMTALFLIVLIPTVNLFA